MLQPLCSVEAIATRQDIVELFLNPNHQVTVGVLQNFLHATGPIDQIILRINKCATKPKDLFVLNRTLSTIISLASVLKNEMISLIENNPTLSRCLQFLRTIYQELNLDVLLDLRECITSVVDEEATFACGDKPERLIIRRGYDEQLDIWREQYENLELLLEEEGSNLCQQYPQLVGLDVVFMQQVGFLVVLCQSMLEHGQVTLPPDFQQVFVDEGLVYFKCEKMRELDEEIEDVDGMIKDREDLIIGELEENILDCENELKETFRAVSTLDCIIAFAGCAADFKFSRPQVVDTDKPFVHIKDGRHPLLEINTGASYVANDIRIDENDRVLVVTGPNYSGKSCYLRQVGLLVYMAHIGSFIPCSQATISLTDQIFARISTVETASRPQSSYQQELTEMASVFARATSKSLVLLDEVGKGTHPSSGISILGAALKKLNHIGCSTVCTTHFLELFSANVVIDREDGIRALQMSIHLPDDNEDNAVPLFKLEYGVASSSAGLVCAKNAGIERKVLVRAKEIIQALKSKTYIEPTIEAMARAPYLTDEEKEVLTLFSSVESWEAATDSQLRSLIQKVSKVGLS
jgi:DNA mismatch repair protein MSH5